MKKRSTEAFLSVYVDLQISDWHSYFDRTGGSGSKVVGGGAYCQISLIW